MGDQTLEDRAVAVVRALAMDAPHRARSGHQGTAMALAPLAHVLWTRTMRYDAADAAWPDRDRLILSAGHASVLLYSMLYLTGYDLTLDDLKAFRQWGSKTPGHPEAGHTSGVEVTTGPLGQGFANGVGMAIAERAMRARYGTDLCDHYIYAICSDGDLMEGVSHEAASLAGHLGLGRLVYVYDDNRVTIDGPTSLTYSDDVAGRFRSYGWHVVDLGDAADDLDAVERGLGAGVDETDAPSLVILRTHIGHPSPGLTDDPAAHGNPFDDDEIAATKAVLGLPVDEAFHVPDDVLDLYRKAGARGRAARDAWRGRHEGAAERAEFDACIAGRGLSGWKAKLPRFEAGSAMATRKASQKCIQAIVDVVPGLVAGGADLTGNSGTSLGGDILSRSDPAGRQFHYGVREHAMGAAMVGMAQHGGLLPVGGTFLVFSDYSRPAVRLAALSRAHTVFAWSHDSVGVGEDGPTHQPVEHVMSLRAIPDLVVIRPADANEVTQAWEVAVDHDGPVAMILTRQDVPVLEGTGESDGVRLGAYVLDGTGSPDVLLVATGSEVSLCVDAAALLAGDGIAAQVVSMPSWELFDAQPDDHRCRVLPPGVPSLSVEAGVTLGWHRYVDDALGLDRFGVSAPGKVVLDNMGFNPPNVAQRARALLEGGPS